MTITLLVIILGVTIATAVYLGRWLVRLLHVRRARIVDVRSERLRIRREQREAEDLLRAATSHALAEMLKAARTSPQSGSGRHRS